jgi:hypothetical protein
MTLFFQSSSVGVPEMVVLVVKELKKNMSVWVISAAI